MRIAAEATEEGRKLFVHHRVMGDVVDELLLLLCGRQLPVEKEVGNLEKVAFFCEFLDRITAVEKDPFIAVDISDTRATGGSRHKSGVVSKVPGLRVEFADIDDPRADRPAQHRK